MTEKDSSDTSFLIIFRGWEYVRWIGESKRALIIH